MSPGSRHSLAVAAIIGAMLCSTPVRFSAQPVHRAYSAVDLGVLPGNEFSAAVDINNRGQIVGYSGSGFSSRAVLWYRGAMRDLGHLPGGSSSFAAAINERGDVVGTTSGLPADFGSVHRGFLWTDRGMMDLGTFPGHTYSGTTDINARGIVLGASFDFAAGGAPVVWTRSGIEALSGLPPGAVVVANAINNRGQVVGYWYMPFGSPRAFLWEDGVFTDLPQIDDESMATDINERGQIVGISNGPDRAQAVMWDRDEVIELGTLPGGTFSIAYGINDRGQVVGYSYIDDTGRTLHAFLWQNGTMIDLGTLGGQFSVAFAINNAGVIVGESTLEDSNSTHAAMWTPR